MNPTHVLNTILAYAADEAMRTGNMEIYADHLLLGIIRHNDNDACRTLSGLGVNLTELKEYLDSHLFRHDSINFAMRDDIKPSREAQNVLSMAFFEASRSNSQNVDESHLLLAINNCPDSKGAAFFRELGFTGADFAVKDPATQEAGPLPEAKPKKESSAKMITFISAANRIKS